MARIASLHAREVLDSRGWPTVEVDVHCDDGSLGRAIVPSGASTGKAEAHELRDGDMNRHGGRGVLRAVAHVNGEIAAALVGLDIADQPAIDRQLVDLDGTPNKRRLGANAVLGASLAVAHAAAASQHVPLWRHLHRLARDAFGILAPRMPLPMTNMISGGAHAGGNIDFQDILVAPAALADTASMLERIARTYRGLGGLLDRAGYGSHLVGDEGGFGPKLPSNERAIEFVVRAIEAAGLVPGRDMNLAVDVASTRFYDGERYHLTDEGYRQPLASDEVIALVDKLVARYPITSIEDPLAEDDWPAWSRLTAKLGDKL